MSSYKNLLQSLQLIANLKKDWDSYGADPPSDTAIKTAGKALSILNEQGCIPTEINPSAEEGLVFEYTVNEHYFMLHFYNDGDIVYLKALNGKKSEAVELNGLDDIIRIAAEIKSYKIKD